MSEKNLRHFNMLITQLEGGALNEELSDKIREIISEISDAAMDRAGTHKGELTLKLKFEMNHKDKIVEVAADVVSKLPKCPRGRAGLFWADEDGNLLRENPRQLTLEDEMARQRERNAEQAITGKR